MDSLKMFNRNNFCKLMSYLVADSVLPLKVVTIHTIINILKCLKNAIIKLNKIPARTVRLSNLYNPWSVSASLFGNHRLQITQAGVLTV